MIKYSLICKNCDLNFESWFASSIEYEKLKKKTLLNCHKCNSINVVKNLMSPNINKNHNNKSDKEFNKYKKIKKVIVEYQAFIRKNFKYVGENFAHEARAIHYEKKKNNIYGMASKKDLRELSEEGIETQIMPWVKDTSN